METLKLYHPSCTSCSFDGVQYDADEDGAFGELQAGGDRRVRRRPGTVTVTARHCRSH